MDAGEPTEENRAAKRREREIVPSTPTKRTRSGNFYGGAQLTPEQAGVLIAALPGLSNLKDSSSIDLSETRLEEEKDLQLCRYGD